MVTFALAAILIVEYKISVNIHLSLSDFKIHGNLSFFRLNVFRFEKKLNEKVAKSKVTKKKKKGINKNLKNRAITAISTLNIDKFLYAGSIGTNDANNSAMLNESIFALLSLIATQSKECAVSILPKWEDNFLGSCLITIGIVPLNFIAKFIKG